jgi:hypothetical protein
MVKRVFFVDEVTDKGFAFDIDPACNAPGSTDAIAKAAIVSAVLGQTRGSATARTTEKLFISRTREEGGWFWMEAEPSILRENDVVVIAKGEPSVR